MIFKNLMENVSGQNLCFRGKFCHKRKDSQVTATVPGSSIANTLSHCAQVCLCVCKGKRHETN